MTNIISMHGSELFDNSVFETVNEQPLITATGENVRTHKAIVDSNRKPIAVVGAKYQLVQNSVLIPQFEVALKQSGLDLSGIQRKVSTSGSKGRTVVRYTLPNHEMRIGNRNDDVVSLEISLLNSYDGSWKFQSMVGAFRMLCTNGMIVGDNFAHFYGKHTKNLDTQRAINNIKHSLVTYHDNADLWNQMAKSAITHDDADKFFERVATSDAMLEYLRTAYMKYTLEVGANVWGVFNALTDWSTHAPSAKTKQADLAVLVQKREATVRKIMPQLERLVA
jgi:hypothetical protein